MRTEHPKAGTRKPKPDDTADVIARIADQIAGALGSISSARRRYEQIVEPAGGPAGQSPSVSVEDPRPRLPPLIRRTDRW